MSYIATAVRVRQASAAAIGEWNMRRPVVTGRRLPLGWAGLSTRAALASNQCGRSQPGLSRNTAPSSFCRAWNGLTRRSRGRFLGLQRVQDVVDLDEVLLGRLADVVRGRAGPLRSGARRSRAGRPLTGRRSAVARPRGRRRPSASPRRPRRSRIRRRRGTRRSSGPPSGVNEKIPLNPVSIVALFEAGQQLLALLPRRAKSSSVKGSIDGMRRCG